MGDVFAKEKNPALVQSEFTCDKLKKGRLAGPIGPDQCAALPSITVRSTLSTATMPRRIGYSLQHESLHVIVPSGWEKNPALGRRL